MARGKIEFGMRSLEYKAKPGRPVTYLRACYYWQQDILFKVSRHSCKGGLHEFKSSFGGHNVIVCDVHYKELLETDSLLRSMCGLPPLVNDTPTPIS